MAITRAMHRRRRLYVVITLAAVAIMGLVLFFSLRPSTMFSISAPPAKPVQPELANLPEGVTSNTLVTVSGTTLLEKPRYTGQDNLGRNWLVTAETAAQSGSSTSSTYILQQVGAEWHDPSQTTPFTIQAQEGQYQPSGSTLQLTGAVSATGAGFTMTAPTIDADLATRNLKASGGSRVVGNTGEGGNAWHLDITAPNLSADQNEQTLTLTGGVHAKITPKQ